MVEAKNHCFNLAFKVPRYSRNLKCRLEVFNDQADSGRKWLATLTIDWLKSWTGVRTYHLVVEMFCPNFPKDQI